MSAKSHALWSHEPLAESTVRTRFGSHKASCEAGSGFPSPWIQHRDVTSESLGSPDGSGGASPTSAAGAVAIGSVNGALRLLLSETAMFPPRSPQASN